MLIRVVRMTFRPSAVDTFLRLFDKRSTQIRAHPGCLHLELWRDEKYPNILTSYSHWTDSDALDSYRQSALFKRTWAATTALFAGGALAFSGQQIRSSVDS